MKASEVLTLAKAIISKPDRWARGAFSLDGDNVYISPYDANPETCSFCAIGAIKNVTAGLGHSAEDNARAILDSVVPDRLGVPYWNDTRSHAEVLRLFDMGIAEAVRLGQ